MDKQPSVYGEAKVHRRLDARHLEMIAIGGTIGTGLFLASGGTIHTAGPLGALLDYILVGMMVYFVVTSLGEMATLLPCSGSFNSYAGRFVDPALGFSVGWNYWFNWAITLPAELTAATQIISYWFPDTKYLWAWCLGFMAILFFLNVLGVRAFGEAEFWFSIIKIVAVCLFIIIGIVIVIKDKIGFSKYSEGGGPFAGTPGGISGFFTVFTAAFFAYGGTELVGITAGEARNPRKTVPKAINGTFYRICIFYVLAIFVIGLMVASDDPLLFTKKGVATSPFTLAFAKAGIPYADHIMNAVILIAVLSAGNSSIYAASRTLMSLAAEGSAPRIFAVTIRGVPIPALSMSLLVGCIAFLGVVVPNSIVFSCLVNLIGLTILFTWVSISVVHLRFRAAYIAQGHKLEDLPYRAPLYPIGDIVSILFGMVVLVGSIYFTVWNDITSWIVLIVIPLYICLFVGYKVFKKSKVVPIMECDFKTGNVNSLSQAADGSDITISEIEVEDHTKVKGF